MRLRSFAMLLPCGIDVFSGVEFVCCPAKKVRKGKKKIQWHSVFVWLYLDVFVSVSVFIYIIFIIKKILR